MLSSGSIKKVQSPMICKFIISRQPGAVPCAVSEKQLIDLKKKLEGKVSIYAYSDEPMDLLDSHIRKKHENKLPFFYAQIPTKENSRKNDLFQFAVTYPYCFVTHKNNLLWHGNPTYPKKAFENFIELWLNGQWNRRIC